MPHLLKTISLTALIALAAPVAAQDAGDAAPADQAETATPEAAGDAPGTENASEAEDAPENGSETEGAPEAQADLETAPESGEDAAPSEADTPVEGQAPGLSMGEDVEAAPADGGAEGVGTTYTEETFGDWQQRCVRTEDGNDPCQLYQLLRDEQGNAVAELSLFALPQGQEAAAGATIITPLETLLTRQITLAVDSGAAKRYPFDFCAQQGCFARIGLTDEDVQSFKRGAVATVTIVPAAAPDQEIALDISLSGFTAGYDAVEAANAE